MHALVEKLSEYLDLRVVQTALDQKKIVDMVDAKVGHCRCGRCKQLIDEIHGRQSNQIQYMVEREGLVFLLNR